MLPSYIFTNADRRSTSAPSSSSAIALVGLCAKMLVHHANLLVLIPLLTRPLLQALVKSREISRSETHLYRIYQLTRGIAPLGTPYQGSGLAKWGELLAKSLGFIKQTNSDIVQLLRQDSEVLARVQESFYAMVTARSAEKLESLHISCFYEQLPLPGAGIVCRSLLRNHSRHKPTKK